MCFGGMFGGGSGGSGKPRTPPTAPAPRQDDESSQDSGGAPGRKRSVQDRQRMYSASTRMRVGSPTSPTQRMLGG